MNFYFSLYFIAGCMLGLEYVKQHDDEIELDIHTIVLDLFFVRFILEMEK